MTTTKNQNNLKIDKYSALINQGFLENKLKMIPTSIKETYSDLVKKKPVLLTRELIADGKVVLGVEYDDNGIAVNAYTTDKKGQHITIVRTEELDNENLSVRDMIAQHLEKMSIMQTNEKVEKNNEKPAFTKKKVVVRGTSNSVKPSTSIKKTNTRV